MNVFATFNLFCPLRSRADRPEQRTNYKENGLSAADERPFPW
jgi:hypothetical protein